MEFFETPPLLLFFFNPSSNKTLDQLSWTASLGNHLAAREVPAAAALTVDAYILTRHTGVYNLIERAGLLTLSSRRVLTMTNPTTEIIHFMLAGSPKRDAATL